MTPSLNKRAARQTDDDLHLIRDRAAVCALASVARQEIADGLAALGPSTVAELASALGRAPSALYYHLQILERVGLVLREETVREDGKTESILRTPGRRMQVAIRPRNRKDARLLHSLQAPLLRATERDLEAAMEQRARAASDDEADDHGVAMAGRTKTWLDDDEFIEVREHLDAIDRLLARARPESGGRLYTFTFALASIEPKDAPRNSEDDTD